MPGKPSLNFSLNYFCKLKPFYQFIHWQPANKPDRAVKADSSTCTTIFQIFLLFALILIYFLGLYITRHDYS